MNLFRECKFAPNVPIVAYPEGCGPGPGSRLPFPPLTPPPLPSFGPPPYDLPIPLGLLAPQPPFWPLKLLLFQSWSTPLAPQVRHRIFAFVGWKPLLARQWA